MFVSLKSRVGACMTAVLLLTLSACGNGAASDVSLQDVNAHGRTTSMLPPIQAEPVERMYAVRPNWPNISVEGIVGYDSDRFCVYVVACVKEEDAVIKASQFVGSAVYTGVSFPDRISESDLREWRETVVGNVCFENSWEAYVGGALLFFAYEDDADAFEYGSVMHQVSMCDKANVLQKPQP